MHTGVPCWNSSDGEENVGGNGNIRQLASLEQLASYLCMIVGTKCMALFQVPNPLGSILVASLITLSVAARRNQR